MPVKHNYKLCQFVMLMLISTSLCGQVPKKKISSQTLSLFVYNNNFEISPKWSLSSDVQERNYIKPVKQSQFFIRSQLNYNLKQNWNAAAGLAYYLSSPGDPASESSPLVGEIRLNQDLSYKQKFQKYSLGHRYRIEERFIGQGTSDSTISGYNFIERLSYSISFEYILSNSAHSLTFKASDGVFINVNKAIIYNMFDQNRFYAGLNYHLVKNIYLEMGYLNLFQQRSSGVQFYNRDIASFSINHKIKRSKLNTQKKSPSHNVIVNNTLHEAD